MTAFVARPDDELARPLVIVCPEIFGVNKPIRQVASQIAALGYLTVAPSFVHRLSGKPEFPIDANGREEGLSLFFQLTRDDVTLDAQAVLKRFGRAGAAIVGFSAGGHIAFYLATRIPFAATAAFYPGWLDGMDIALSRPTPTLSLASDIAKQRGRLLILFGGDDHLITHASRLAVATALTTAGVQHETVTYPDTAHGFFFEGRESYRAAAADDAWGRLRALLAECLPAPSVAPPSCGQ
jgi:carboxymethylenebutenolidase